MDTIINAATAAFESLTHAPAWFLLLIVLNLVGVFMQKIERVPNLLIPVVLVGLGIFFLIILSDPATLPPTQPHPKVVIGLMGFIVGAAAYSLHFALVKAWRRWMAEKFPEPPTPPAP